MLQRFLSWLKSGTPLAVALKVIGSVSALVSLFLGVVQVKNVVGKWRSGRTAGRELQAAAELKLSTRDYAQAWALVSAAVDSFPASAAAKTMQLEVAMAWLRDVSVSSAAGDPSFSAVSDKVTSVLLRAASRSQGREKADALAHLGWLTFLKWRDGATHLSVAQPYLQALATDSTDLYAHVMLGHWLLYPGGGGGTLEQTRAYFESALRAAKTPEQRQLVRSWQVTALLNRDEQFLPELIRLSAVMKAEGDTLNHHDRSRILWFGYTAGGWRAFARLADSVPASKQLEALPWLSEGSNADSNPHYRTVFARLLELSGDTAAAVRRYRAIQKEFPNLDPADREFIKRDLQRR